MSVGVSVGSLNTSREALTRLWKARRVFEAL